MIEQIIQIAGALLVLAGFTLAQFNLLPVTSYRYLWLNFIGSAILAALALAGSQWGFLLLEGVWALVSAWSLARKFSASSSASGAG
ncbi:MAG TPA: hypothetical protein VFK45_02390 [Gammaproteobacteria bacterium]|nr:hypothetical protein [Gammaproteobacteria bacterium]